MNYLFLLCDSLPSTLTCILLLLALTTAYHELIFCTAHHKPQAPNNPPEPPDPKPRPSLSPSPSTPQFTALQQHILFWNPSGSGIIYPRDIYSGFRLLGFNPLFALTALLIPLFFSYPTHLPHSTLYLPDPWWRIHVLSIHKAKHGSDSGVYDLGGNLRGEFFEGLFAEFDGEGRGSLGMGDLWRLLGRNRVAADLAGWSFAAMEWGTTWLLLQRNGRLEKKDLMACYDGSIFWSIVEENLRSGCVKCGYGLREFCRDVWGWLRKSEKVE